MPRRYVTGRRGGSTTTRRARRMDWGGFDYSVAVAAGTTSSAWVITPADVRSLFTDPTIMFSRVIMHARMSGGAAPAAPALTAVAVGLLRVTGDPDAAAPAVGDQPEPYTDPEADWLFHMVYPVAPGTAIGTMFFPSGDERAMHSRAMRRLGNNAGLMLFVEAAGQSFDVSVHVRYLLKE